MTYYNSFFVGFLLLFALCTQAADAAKPAVLVPQPRAYSADSLLIKADTTPKTRNDWPLFWALGGGIMALYGLVSGGVWFLIIGGVFGLIAAVSRHIQKQRPPKLKETVKRPRPDENKTPKAKGCILALGAGAVLVGVFLYIVLSYGQS